MAELLEWQNGNVPRSSVFDDIYYSSDGGLSESKAVFLDGINAPEVWRGKKDFIICQLGFGTGLNFLNTLKLWLENSSRDQTLHYLATELYPLQSSAIERAIHWPALSDYKHAFLKYYPLPEFELFDERVKFKLLKGDSKEQLEKMKCSVDAWFLDGFAPRKNPDMWSSEIFNEMARLSREGTQVATFTAAGFVRRGLSGAGFKMTKRPGFGKKREMMSGEYQGT